MTLLPILWHFPNTYNQVLLITPHLYLHGKLHKVLFDDKIYVIINWFLLADVFNISNKLFWIWIRVDVEVFALLLELVNGVGLLVNV